MSAMNQIAAVPPPNRPGHPAAAQRYPIACTTSAHVLDAEGQHTSAEAVRHIGARVAAAPAWPAEVCMCAIVPCTETGWTRPGHCCRTERDHTAAFEQAHAQACAADAHAGGVR